MVDLFKMVVGSRKPLTEAQLGRGLSDFRRF